MARFFLEPGAWTSAVELTGDEAVHCGRVLRAREGDRIEIFDGAGKCADATIVSIGRHRVGLELGEITHTEPPAVRTILAQSVLKGKAMDWLIQKAVELGVSEVQPIITEHCVMRPAEAKAGKWQRAALEACKQCGQNHLPLIAEPVSLAAFLEPRQPGLGLVASLAEPRRRLREVIDELGEVSQVAYVVGPEGDFSATELEAILQAGFVPVSLGSRILRSETAALFGIGALQDALG